MFLVYIHKLVFTHSTELLYGVLLYKGVYAWAIYCTSLCLQIDVCICIVLPAGPHYNSPKFKFYHLDLNF